MFWYLFLCTSVPLYYRNTYDFTQGNKSVVIPSGVGGQGTRATRTSLLSRFHGHWCVRVSCPGDRVSHSRVWSAEVSWGESWQAGGRQVAGTVVSCRWCQRIALIAVGPFRREASTQRPRVQKILTTEVSSSDAQLGECWPELSLTRRVSWGPSHLLRAPRCPVRKPRPPAWWAHRGDRGRLPKCIGTWPARGSRRIRVSNPAGGVC